MDKPSEYHKISKKDPPQEPYKRYSKPKIQGNKPLSLYTSSIPSFYKNAENNFNQFQGFNGKLLKRRGVLPQDTMKSTTTINYTAPNPIERLELDGITPPQPPQLPPPPLQLSVEQVNDILKNDIIDSFLLSNEIVRDIIDMTIPKGKERNYRTETSYLWSSVRTTIFSKLLEKIKFKEEV